MWRYLFGSKLKACFDILGSVHLTKGAFLDMFYETELPAGLVFRVDWFHILMEEKSKTKQRKQVNLEESHANEHASKPKTDAYRTHAVVQEQSLVDDGIGG